MDIPKTDNIVYAGLTDTGKQRSNNEDNWICRHIWNENTIIAAVIDGVGGYEGGEVAAQIAAEELVAYLEKYPNGERKQLLKEAVVYANNRIFEERNNNQQLSSMGCVITSILIEQNKSIAHMAHVGDTRLYEYYEGCLTKRSHDQSLIGRYEEMGLLSEKEAMEHPMRNIIERDLGHKQLANATEDYIEIVTFPLKENSSWLLCSDGLTDMLTVSQITQILANYEQPDEQAKALIEAANEAGGKDNITVVILRIPEYEKQLTTQKGETIRKEKEGIKSKNGIKAKKRTETKIPFSILHTQKYAEKDIPTQKTNNLARKRKYFLYYLGYILAFSAGWSAHYLYIENKDTEIDQDLSRPKAQDTIVPTLLYQSIQTETDSIQLIREMTQINDSTNSLFFR